MQTLGRILMIGGAIVGAAAGVWVLTGSWDAGLPWLVAIGLVKLSVFGSFGMMGAGAALTRLAKRRERALLDPQQHTLH